MLYHPKIGIIGIGMVGKEVKRWFLECGWKKGYDLFCYDIDPSKPDLKDDVNRADIIFVCVPTPSNSDGSCNVDIVDGAISKFKNSNKLIVIKSTVPPGTTEAIGERYNVATIFNPEFLTEKQAWLDFIKPDRQIVGFTKRSKSHAKLLLSILPRATVESPSVVNTYHYLQLTSTEAELAKYFCNMFGAIKVSYANAISFICEGVGAEYESVRKIVSGDSRIGDAWMDVTHGAYRGFGGYCFPKDARALISFSYRLSIKLRKKDPKLASFITASTKLFEAVYDFNERVLEIQGLTIEGVSGHIDEKKMKKLSKKKRSGK